MSVAAMGASVAGRNAGQGIDEVVAVAALIDCDGRVLLSCRPEGKVMAGKWEFPGGKIEAGERPEAALIRELREELSIDVTASCLAPLSFVTYDWPHGFVLVLLYVCRKWEGLVRSCEGQGLRWTHPSDWSGMDILAANGSFMAALREEL